MFLAARVVPESKDPNVSGRPDILGAGLLAAAVGLVALALVKAPEWGWGSASFLGLLAASVVCGAAMVYRSRRHHSPVIELELLRSRTFSGSFAASILYYAGFGAFVLSSVEFLTGVWHYSAVEAGLAIAPGPLMVLPFARLVAPRLTVFLGGPGRVAVIGCFVNALAQALWLWRIQVAPSYVSHLLPAQLLGGAGVGLTIPSLLGAGSASLTPARFGTGSGILNTGRQVGTVLGVAGLVAILARVSPADPLAAFRGGLVLVIAFFAAAGVVSAVLLGGRLGGAPSGGGAEGAVDAVAAGPVEAAPRGIALMTGLSAAPVGRGRGSASNLKGSVTMSVTAFQDYRLADRDREWDGAAAEKRVRQWARRRGRAEREVPRRPRLVRQRQQGQLHRLQAAHRRRHRRADQGRAARGDGRGPVVQGARGGANLPDDDVDRVKSHLAKYYAKMGEQAPWERG